MNTHARAIALELKDDGDPAEIVTKALADLNKVVDDRLKVVETKSVDAAKLTDRLDKLEAKFNRPGKDEPANDNQKIEIKAFTNFIRSGCEAMARRKSKA